MPPPLAGRTAWADVSADDTQPGSMPSRSTALLARLRSKVEKEEVLEWLGSAVDPQAGTAPDTRRGEPWESMS
jgi:hypothetical protein